MRILLAGGNGFIGSSLYSQLIERTSVTSIDYSNSSFEKGFTNVDLTDINNVNEFAENSEHFDVLIFLVGLAHAKGKGKDLPEFKKVNFQTLSNLFSVLEKFDKVPDKIIFASTVSVYGEKYHQNTYGEDSVKKPFSPYAVTKLLAEQYLLDKYAYKSWILRFAPVYSSDFLLNINRRTNMGGRFYKVGTGFKKLSLCNIENIKTAIDGIIEGNVPSGIYNLSDPQDYTYDKLLMWRNASRIIRIPLFSVRILYYLGKLLNSTFLKENSVKLTSDNVYPSDKIRSYVDLPAVINDVKFDND